MAAFTDDFNRADSSTLGAGWVEVSGDWSIVSNQLSPGAAGGTIILRAAGAMSSDDNFAQFTIAATAAASQGIWCRGNSNISSGYLWRNNGTSWDLFSVVGGSFTVIGSYAAAAASGDVAKIQAVGSTIKGYVGGVQRVSVTDTSVTTGTSVGIRSESAAALKFDDFSAGDVTAGATLAIPAATETTQALTGAKTAPLNFPSDIATSQPLVGAKVATLSTTSAGEAALALAGGKALTLGVGAASETAPPLTGTKAGGFTPASTVETAQGLAGAKTSAIGFAAESEATQAVEGAKASLISVVTALESTQGPAGTKQTALAMSEHTETARPLPGAVAPTLGLTVGIETARPLEGTKAATLSSATEVATAVHLAGPAGERIDGYAAGTPLGRWAASRPRRAWLSAGTPRT
ncbi:hypothetical protein ACIBEA_29850 [Streptomyces sp. NPDC051555]|uniref:hypothetical protein n=1 Tax=Streptomyces sp. NPDC051555 TaxID=3365657 RepID=UPI0037ACED16